jgi:nucleoside-triphosphatase THEP1
MVVAGQLNPKWMKAAVLGCLWASSEIVLGSFLHNLRVPFSGNILTGIGLMILISVSYLWKEKGLFWRAGLVCALMKTVSPSAVIFGPMIAIMSEALLLEISTRLLGRNWAGFIIGGVLAMSWNLVQRVANLIIVYGFNIVDLYNNLVSFAQKQLSIQGDITWKPLIILWFIYFLMGVAASVAGIYIGRRALKQPARLESLGTQKIRNVQSDARGQVFNWSLWWFAFNISGMVAVLFLMNKSGWMVWIPASLFILTLWGYRYHRALRPLKKPRFWIFFALITMLTSFLFVKLGSQGGGWMAGFMTGLQMNVRAAVMIVGFSTIGTELYNPVIRQFFERSSFRQLPMALEVAFDTLPQAIAKLPAARNIFRTPVSVVHQMVAQADYFLGKVAVRFREKPFIVILTGKIGSGKTSLLADVADRLKNQGIPAGGILSPAITGEEGRLGYDIINVATGERRELSRVSGEDNSIRVGRYAFFPDGLEFGKSALSYANYRGVRVVLVDEMGPWELEGQGWAGKVNEILLNCSLPMVWVVRDSITELVIDEWNLTGYEIFRVPETTADEIIEYLKGRINIQNTPEGNNQIVTNGLKP